MCYHIIHENNLKQTNLMLQGLFLKFIVIDLVQLL